MELISPTEALSFLPAWVGLPPLFFVLAAICVDETVVTDCGQSCCIFIRATTLEMFRGCLNEGGTVSLCLNFCVKVRRTGHIGIGINKDV